MRRFRFVGDPEEYGGKFISARQIVDENYSANGSDPLLSIVRNYPNDWQEVFDNDGGTILNQSKPLHKDTDLGYYAGLAMCEYIKQYSNRNNELIASEAISLALELIKQLDSLSDNLPPH